MYLRRMLGVNGAAARLERDLGINRYVLQGDSKEAMHYKALRIQAADSTTPLFTTVAAEDRNFVYIFFLLIR